MSTLSDAVGEYEQLTYRRVSGTRRMASLALLLTGSAKASDPAAAHFEQFASEQRMDLKETWAAMSGDHPVASLLIVPAAGRSAMVFASPVSLSRQGKAMTELAKTACRAQDKRRVRLFQSLLDANQSREMHALVDAGFDPLAELIYQQRDITTDDAAPDDAALDVHADVNITTWHRKTRPLFERAILASYEDTLDCPRLVGVRDINDIIDGHMAAGTFSPDLWFVLTHGDEPVAVMLLNTVQQRRALELVYLGVCKAWRGRGIGKTLVRHAIAQACARDLSLMLLAVDQDNQPARRLYESLGFAATARKHALIFTP